MHTPNFLQNRRGLAVLGVLCASLLLRADGCVVEEKSVDGVATFTITHTWVSAGFTEANFSDTYTLTAEDVADIDDAVNGLDNVDTLGDPVIAGAKYHVVSSTGHDARRAGSINVGAQTLLTFDIASNATGVSGVAGDGTLTLNGAGVNLVLNAIRAFVDGNPNALDNFAFDADWTSTPAPSNGSPDNFTWVTELVIQVPVTFKFDGPS